MEQYQTLFSLKGRTFWFFGGAGYLGSHGLLLALSAGARVVCIDREDRAECFVKQHVPEEWRGRVNTASLDVADVAACERFVEEQCVHNGPPDGLVMLAFSSTGKALDALSTEEFDAVNHVNLSATFSIVRRVGNAMAASRKRGSIVLFSSMYGSIAPEPGIYPPPMNPNPIEYGMSKAALSQMARYLAVHWGKEGIRCNSIAPGPFPFPSLQESAPDFIEALGAKTPLGRIGQASEIAGSILFLLSDASSYITGHNLAVDGGWTAW